MPTEPLPTVGLAILARRAEVGRGKSRLAAGVGAQRAYEIYRHLIAATAAAARDSGLPCVVCFDPAPGDEGTWDPENFQYTTQPTTPDLGERIAAAYHTGAALAAEPARPAAALVIGTDCPTLTGAVLAQAAASLTTHDAVLGPSYDGGFYLIGLRQLPVALFEHVTWSTDAVAAQVRDAFRQNDWRWRELPPLRDIDTAADWRAYSNRVPSPQSEPT